MLGVVILLSIVGTTWSIAGIPVRALVAIVALGLTFLLVPNTVVRSVRRNIPALSILGGFALLGGLVSLANETPVSEVINEVVQIHVQAAIIFLLTYSIAMRVGRRRAGLIFILCVSASAFVAAAQSLGMPWAWSIRLDVARIVGEDLLSDYYYRYQRPMGLSYSPVRLGLQICLALAAYLVTMRNPYLGMKRFDNRLVVALVIFAISAIAGQNRSPILGGILLYIFYIAGLRPKYIGFLVASIIIIIPVSLNFLDSLDGVRVATVADESSLGRITFFVYGIMLFVSRPIGYGLAFNPIDHWPEYWEAIQWTPVPHFIQIFPLHNYPLTILNMYGVLVLAFMPTVFRVAKKYGLATLSLVPYFVHILFHNDGPMWSDFLVWFVFAFAVAAKDTEISNSLEPKGR
jgi:hypothetical protein